MSPCSTSLLAGPWRLWQNSRCGSIAVPLLIQFGLHVLADAREPRSWQESITVAWGSIEENTAAYKAKRAAMVEQTRQFPNRYPDTTWQPITRFRLEYRDGKWQTIGPRGTVRTAKGRYIFVRQGPNIWVVRARGRGVIGANPARHIDLARGADVEYAGEIQFGSSHSGRGQIRWWDNASGHYRPEGVYAHQAGLPMHLFRNYTGD
jgi:hypothetical protein